MVINKRETSGSVQVALSLDPFLGSVRTYTIGGRVEEFFYGLWQVRKLRKRLDSDFLQFSKFP